MERFKAIRPSLFRGEAREASRPIDRGPPESRADRRRHGGPGRHRRRIDDQPRSARANPAVDRQRRAGHGGAIALGLLLQILMSIVIASVYALPTRRLPWLVSRPLAAGLAFGVGVFVVMNLVVVPLSAFAPKPKHVTLAFLSLNLAAMLVFGVLVATLARWSLRRAGDADLVGG